MTAENVAEGTNADAVAAIRAVMMAENFMVWCWLRGRMEGVR